jgi:class 3 adenylate cyclase
MKKQFADALVNAQGRSEFIIVVVADIRGFSSFSTINESPNIAMFIKRFYLQLINKYFKGANFVKPTGDGLLMTFSYSEDNLLKVSEEVIGSCLSCLNDFPNICVNDPMINFPVPQAIGFGIARGTACCLYSGKETLDYSGHLLNLASRLNDLARPSGIVVDGNYLESVIPESARGMFKEQQVYVRSIAEEIPMKVLYLDSYVRISDSSLAPLVGETWKTVSKTFTIGQLAKIGQGWRQDLPTQIKSIDKVKVTIIFPKRGKGMKGLLSFIDFKDFTYIEEGAAPILRLDLEKAKKKIPDGSLAQNTKIMFKIEYVPKTLIRT